ncbi:MAG: DarT1-associated NADAR antitoxin family protein [Pseudothermotoga sp.]
MSEEVAAKQFERSITIPKPETQKVEFYWLTLSIEKEADEEKAKGRALMRQLREILHNKAEEKLLVKNILEISTISNERIGRNLSSIYLKVDLSKILNEQQLQRLNKELQRLQIEDEKEAKKVTNLPVEIVFQCSKVFSSNFSQQLEVSSNSSQQIPMFDLRSGNWSNKLGEIGNWSSWLAEILKQIREQKRVSPFKFRKLIKSKVRGQPMSKAKRGKDEPKEVVKLTEFNLFGDIWPLEPKTAFYDWLYINALLQNRGLADELLKYDAFTDIYFTRNRFNCQAYSAAFFVLLKKTGKISNADRISREEFEKIIESFGGEYYVYKGIR